MRPRRMELRRMGAVMVFNNATFLSLVCLVCLVCLSLGVGETKMEKNKHLDRSLDLGIRFDLKCIATTS